MVKKILTTLGALSLSAILMAGCGTQTPPQETKSPAAAATTPSTSNVLLIGVDDSYPPMEFKDETGKNTIGFDIDFAKELGKRLGKSEVKFESINFDNIFSALDSKKYDMVISSISIREDRKEKYSLSKPYIANKQVIVTSPSNTNIKSFEDLAGKKVCAQSGTTSSDLIEAKIKAGTKMDFTKYDKVTEALNEIKLGRVEAALIDKVVALYYTKKDPSKFKIAWESAEAEPLAVCLRKSDASLRDKVNSLIDEMTKDGTMKKISDSWFGQDITGGLN